jgi:hypothetical protein
LLRKAAINSIAEPKVPPELLITTESLKSPKSPVSLDSLMSEQKETPVLL